jgi:hypothetical protein
MDSPGVVEVYPDLVSGLLLSNPVGVLEVSLISGGAFPVFLGSFIETRETSGSDCCVGSREMRPDGSTFFSSVSTRLMIPRRNGVIAPVELRVELRGIPCSMGERLASGAVGGFLSSPSAVISTSRAEGLRLCSIQ